MQIIENKYYNISIVHNGQITITDKLLSFIKDKDIKIDKNITSDSIYLLYLLSYYLNQYEILNKDILINIVSEIQNLLEGSYNCICIINNNSLLCFKDKNSIRPLVNGKCNSGKSNDKREKSSDSKSIIKVIKGCDKRKTNIAGSYLTKNNYFSKRCFRNY